MAASRPGCLVNLYLLNLALLLTHEIDSAFWREWELFGIPGGIQTFLILNLVLIVIGLWGLKALAAGGRTGIGLSLVVALAGLLAVGIHTYFIVTGHPQFQTPASLAVLGGIFVLSSLQAVITLRVRRGAGGWQTRGAIKIASTGSGQTGR